MFSVEGKTVLVTGGGRGIGLMIARGYVHAGAKVIITSRDAKALEEATTELNKEGPGSCYFIQADLQKEQDLEKLVAEVKKREDKLHVLVGNAGATWGAPFNEYPASAFDKVLTLNVSRVFQLTQALTPLLLKAVEFAHQDGSMKFTDPARVINIGSVDGIHITKVEHYAYSASKAALHQMTKVLANKLGPQGISVNAIACGPFESKMMAATLAKARASIVASIPLGRIGEPDDVAGTCIYLSSKAGSYVNGAILPLDGGSLVRPKL